MWCEDTCVYDFEGSRYVLHGDGECQDGEVGSVDDVCPLGTDCADCGPRVMWPPSPPPAPPFAPVPTGGEVVNVKSFVFTFDMTLAIDVVLFDLQRKLQLKESIKELCVCIKPTCYVEIRIMGGSVGVSTMLIVPMNEGTSDANAATSAAAAVGAAAATLVTQDTTSLSASLGVPVTQVTPTVTSQVGVTVPIVLEPSTPTLPPPLVPPPPPPPPLPAPEPEQVASDGGAMYLMYAAAGGGGIILTALCCCVCMARRRAAQRVARRSRYQKKTAETGLEVGKPLPPPDALEIGEPLPPPQMLESSEPIPPPHAEPYATVADAKTARGEKMTQRMSCRNLSATVNAQVRRYRSHLDLFEDELTSIRERTHDAKACSTRRGDGATRRGDGSAAIAAMTSRRARVGDASTSRTLGNDGVVRAVRRGDMERPPTMRERARAARPPEGRNTRISRRFSSTLLDAIKQPAQLPPPEFDYELDPPLLPPAHEILQVV